MIRLIESIINPLGLSLMGLIGILSLITALYIVVLFLSPVVLRSKPLTGYSLQEVTRNTKYRRMALIPSLSLVILFFVCAVLFPAYRGEIAIVMVVLPLVISCCLLPVRTTFHYAGFRHLLTPKDTSDSSVAPSVSVERFLPLRILSLLNKESVDEVNEGDNIRQYFSILAVDPFSFLDSGMLLKREEYFRTVADYINVYSTLFKSNNAVFYNFASSQALAFFRQGSVGPLDVAIRIQKRVAIEFQKNTGDVDIDSSRATTYRPQYCAIVQGNVSVGFVSYNNTLQVLASSNTVNVALQLQRLAQNLKIPILVSQDFVDSNNIRDSYNVRIVGMLYKKENNMPVRAYEVLDGYPQDRLEKLLATRTIFEEACEAREQGNVNLAYSKFSYVLANDPLDSLSQYFLDITRQKISVAPT